MKVLFNEYPKCSTCKKAKKWLDDNGVAYDDRHIVELDAMSEDEQLEVLASNGMLVKRPLVVGDDFVFGGFREKDWEEKLLG